MTATNTGNLSSLIDVSGNELLDAYLALLPEPNTVARKTALEALKLRDYAKCKVLANFTLSDPFIKAIAYLSSIPNVVDKGVPTLPTLTAEACRAIVDSHADDEKNSIREAIENLNKKIYFRVTETSTY